MNTGYRLWIHQKHLQNRVAQATALCASLTTISNDEMVQRVEARYEAAEQELITLEAELARLQSGERHKISLSSALPVLQTVIEHREDVPRQERRSRFESEEVQAEQEAQLTAICASTDPQPRAFCGGC